jgi:hypothetical protein
LGKPQQGNSGRLSASEPDNPESQRPHAQSLHSFGDLQLQSGQYVEALEENRHVLEIAWRSIPDVADARRDLSISEKMGDATAAWARTKPKDWTHA